MMIHELFRQFAFKRDHRFTQRRLSPYLDDELSEAAGRRVDGHVGVCPECRRLLATLKRTVESLRGLSGRGRPGLSDGIIERLPPP